MASGAVPGRLRAGAAPRRCRVPRRASILSTTRWPVSTSIILIKRTLQSRTLTKASRSSRASTSPS
eukprot:752733-Prymnesium_polylepis.1